MFTTVLYRIGLKDFDAILVPVNFFTAGTDLIFRRAGKASLHQKCLHKLLKIDALEERKFVKALPSQKGGY